MLDYQYAQVKSFVNKIQIRGELSHVLTHLEWLVLKLGQTHLLSKIYKLLLGTIMFTDVARGRWQRDLQGDNRYRLATCE